MRKYRHILYGYIFVALAIVPTVLFSQTGVHTRTSAHALHIDAGKDNATAVTSSQELNDVIVTADGKMGIGTLEPVTKVDLRSADQKGIVGLGATAQTAASAGAGALRYDTSTKALQYSDGVAWHTIPDKAPPKALVMANKSISQVISQNSDSQYIKEWVKVVDTEGNFDASTGIFTATRDGFYIVSFSMTLASADIANNSVVETIIESNNSVNNIRTFRSVNSYPAWAVGT